MIAPIPLEQQEPITHPPSKSEYWQKGGKQISRDVFRIRGQPKNTLFAKKSAHSIMVPRGQTLFSGAPSTIHRYFPIGIISDINEVHTAGERYFWNTNIISNEKFWIGGTPFLSSKKAVTLTEIRSHLQTNTKKMWVELMLGGSKTAIRALACTADTFYNDKTSLSYRLNLVSQAIFLRKTYGISVPLLIVEGDVAPYLYTEKMLQADITATLEGIKKGTFPYMNKGTPPKVTCEEQLIIIDFLETLTNTKFEGSLTLYGTKQEYDKSPGPLPYHEYVKKIDEKNTKLLRAYLATLAIDTTPRSLKESIDSLKLLGFESAERDYLRNVLSTSPLSEQTLVDLFVRNVALGHIELIKELLKIPEGQALLTKAILPNKGGLLEVAVKNEQLEMVKFLLSKNCNPHTENMDNISPLEMIEQMATSGNTAKLPLYKEIHTELMHYKPMLPQTTRPGLRFKQTATPSELPAQTDPPLPGRQTKKPP